MSEITEEKINKPENANENCVGPLSSQAGKAEGCEGCPNQSICQSGSVKSIISSNDEISRKLNKIYRIILVLSGKGGVGKSTCSAQLAFSLADRGNKVGILDLDICGPSIPLLLGVKNAEVHQSSSGWSPVFVDVDGKRGDGREGEIGVMSIGFLVPNEDSAIVWRGPKKTGLIEQFITGVDWGELDYLVIDTPPGTSDEHISIVQLLSNSLKVRKEINAKDKSKFGKDGAIVISTPQEVAMMDVRKELNFCKVSGLDVIGVVENMSTSFVNFSELLESDLYMSPAHGSTVVDKSEKEELRNKISKLIPELFSLKIKMETFHAGSEGSNVLKMAEKFGVKFLGKVPMDKKIGLASEEGKRIERNVHWEEIVDKIIEDDNPNIHASSDELDNMQNGVIEV